MKGLYFAIPSSANLTCMPYKASIFLLFIGLVFASKAQRLTRYESSNFTQSATYEEAMAFYQRLEEQYDEVTIFEQGDTDIGIPLHVVLLHAGVDKSPKAIRQSGKALWLINNGIHPGETDGISASQMFARDLLEDKKRSKEFLSKVAIAIIPFYNIGGALNRNSTTRVNQNGPVTYGFRGNARHYDLNRDFIKSDTRNSQSFQEIFQLFDPDLILDTHVSNGADYQHVMTLVSSQKDKMGGELGKFVEEELLPFSFAEMKSRGFEAIPYVNAWGSTPDKGWSQFLDWPRYSTGYAALFHTIGFMSETHMLKTYRQRVASTYALMHTMLDFLSEKGEELVALREQTKSRVANQKQFDISWRVDTTRFSPLMFSGYEPTYVKSEISGLMRLKYDRNQPFTKPVKYRNNYMAHKVITAPKYYVIPQQWKSIINLLALNKVTLEPLQKDSTITVEAYIINDYKTLQSPYEGHYKHFDVTVSQRQVTIPFRKGDLLVPVNQWRNRYIVETLEPEAPDSFFAWNFFDSILQQKEHFSSYVFEDYALTLLEENPILRDDLAAAKAADSTLRKSADRQLDFIYQRSKHREPEFLRYPVFRILN